MVLPRTPPRRSGNRRPAKRAAATSRRPGPKVLLALNKPYHVLCQFTDPEQRPTLANYVSLPHVYPAGRLDYTSEGLLLLTGDGALQRNISDPRSKLSKCYWAQLEGVISDVALRQLEAGVTLKDGLSAPAKAQVIEPPSIWPRDPPIRERKNSPTSWIALTITEGRNRQVRRMTAAVGFATLRLVRYSIGPWTVDNLAPGKLRELAFPTQWPP